MIKKLLIGTLLLFALLISGCSEETSGLTVQEKKIRDANFREFVTNCENVPGSDECESSMQKYLVMINSWNEPLGLYPWLPTYQAPKDTKVCRENTDSNECKAKYLYEQARVFDRDLTCTNVPVFKAELTCIGAIKFKNLSARSFKEILDVSLEDENGKMFESDIYGTYGGPFGTEIELAPSVSFNLNPGMIETFYFGFSIPDLRRNYVALHIRSPYSGNFNYEIPLCRNYTNVSSKWTIYENANVLRHCKFKVPRNSDYGDVFVNKKFGTEIYAFH